MAPWGAEATRSPHLPTALPKPSIPGAPSTHLGAGGPAGARAGPPGVAGAGPRAAVGAAGWQPRAVGVAPAERGAAGARGCRHQGLPGPRWSWGRRSGGVRVGGWLCPPLSEHRHLPRARTGCHLCGQRGGVYVPGCVPTQALSPLCASVSPLGTFSVTGFRSRNTHGPGRPSSCSPTPCFPCLQQNVPEQRGDGGCPGPSRPTQALPPPGQCRYLTDTSEAVEEAAESLPSGTTGGWMGSGTRALLLRAERALSPSSARGWGGDPHGHSTGGARGVPAAVTRSVTRKGEAPRTRPQPHPRVPAACAADLVPFRARVPVRDSWVLWSCGHRETRRRHG